MTLRRKLLLAQLPLALALVVVGVVSRGAIGLLDRSARDILRDNEASLRAAQTMREAAERLGLEEPSAAQAGEEAATFERALRFQEGNVTEEGEAQMTETLRAAWARLRETPADPRARAAALLAVSRPLDGIVRVNQEAMARKSAAAARAADRARGLTVGIGLAALALALVAVLWISGRLLRPLAVLAQAVRRIAAGDLAQPVRVTSRDEIGEVARELEALTARLTEYRQSSLGELLQAQRTSQAAIDSLPDPVLVFRDGAAPVNVNRACQELLGLDDGDPPEKLAAPARQVVERLRDHVLAGRGAYLPHGFEEAFVVDGPDGPRALLGRAMPIAADEGGLGGATVLLQDVTRLRRFDELKNDLVATVAHEFRTPLTSLRMTIDLCVDRLIGPLTAKQDELLGAARKDVARLQTLVDDLLDLSRIQAGRVELEVRPVAARELVDHVVAPRATAAAARGVTVRAAAVGDAVAADPARVDLVLTNLVENALRFAPAGSAVEVGAEAAGGEVRFSVRDRGPGIAPEHVPHLFDRFYRVPGAPAGGAGLGLYLVKELVAAHGGRVGVDTAPGEGATFWFTLPRAGAADAR